MTLGLLVMGVAAVVVWLNFGAAAGRITDELGERDER